MEQLLLYSISQRQIEIVSNFISKGISVNIYFSDSYDLTPLHFVIRSEYVGTENSSDIMIHPNQNIFRKSGGGLLGAATNKDSLKGGCLLIKNRLRTREAGDTSSGGSFTCERGSVNRF
jgi:hypothetical protein